jgi:HD-GYP domain-containing protein (c-di-GMP phosphodiesterase class II)
MSSEAPADIPSPGPDLVAALTRERGAPLLEALERHLPGAGEHAEATGSYAFVVAAELGQSRGRCELQRETARLHEIGLVYVPKATLDRPAAELGAQDAAVIETHFEAGFRLARGAGVPEQVCGWLLRTRERYDGFGPGRLAAAAIPIESRICRAACACASLLAETAETAQIGARASRASEALAAAAGRELDPGVVEALASALDRIARGPDSI